jgi:hypothetical protein
VVLWVVMPSGVVAEYERFGGPHCLQLQGWSEGTTTQKTKNSIFIAIKSSTFNFLVVCRFLCNFIRCLNYRIINFRYIHFTPFQGPHYSGPEHIFGRVSPVIHQPRLSIKYTCYALHHIFTEVTNSENISSIVAILTKRPPSQTLSKLLYYISIFTR